MRLLESVSDVSTSISDGHLRLDPDPCTAAVIASAAPTRGATASSRFPAQTAFETGIGIESDRPIGIKSSPANATPCTRTRTERHSNQHRVRAVCSAKADFSKANSREPIHSKKPSCPRSFRNYS